MLDQQVQHFALLVGEPAERIWLCDRGIIRHQRVIRCRLVMCIPSDRSTIPATPDTETEQTVSDPEVVNDGVSAKTRRVIKIPVK